MTFSIREQAIREVVRRLALTGTPAVKVFRSQIDQIDADSDLPCFDVAPGDWRIADPGEFGDHQAKTLTQPLIVTYVVDAGTAEGTDGSGAAIDDSALDAGYVWAEQQLIGADGTLGGIVYAVRSSGGAPVFRPAGRAIIGAEMHYELIVGLQRGNPTVKG